MIVVTGGAGFIGQNLVRKLIDIGHTDIVIIDNNFDRLIQVELDLNTNQNVTCMSIADSYLWFGFNGCSITTIFHLGARTDTMERDVEIFNEFNLNYSKFIWKFCTEYRIPLIYASSAATYGNAEDGFDDNDPIDNLKPLNPYGDSKQQFDLYVMKNATANNEIGEVFEPPHWCGFKFFNVYGNHEQHKGSMASVMLHFYKQIKKTGKIKLFRSHVDYCEDGEQKRDFIYVLDIVDILVHVYENKELIPSNIYNLGTGRARTYNELAKAIFNELDIPENISYIDTPLEIRDSYQYYTQAKMGKLLNIRCFNKYQFIPLRVGISLYIKQLKNENY